jgi:hypothetical protein
MKRKERITRISEPDGEDGDEVVAYGRFHMERMDKGFIWFNVAGQSFELWSSRKIHWRPQYKSWDELRAPLEEEK